jgi:uncharacterized RDD family membrane protein YckC
MQNTTPQNLFTTPSIKRRMACWLYEGILLYAIVYLANYFFSVITKTEHGLQNRLGQQVFSFIVMGLYFCYCWSKGQTLAMKTWKIGIRDRLGNLLSWKRAFIRYCLAWVWFLPPLVFYGISGIAVVYMYWLVPMWVIIWVVITMLRKDKQFLHDVFAGTRLVSVY